MRRQFRLPADDECYLDTNHPNWEAVIEGSVKWLLVNEFPIPIGYVIRGTSEPVGVLAAAVRILDAYPDAGLDMVWVYPPVARATGTTINNLSDTSRLDDKVWQQWSRHYTPQNPWRTGIDDVASHLTLVSEWFAREFRKP